MFFSLCFLCFPMNFTETTLFAIRHVFSDNFFPRFANILSQILQNQSNFQVGRGSKTTSKRAEMNILELIAIWVNKYIIYVIWFILTWIEYIIYVIWFILTWIAVLEPVQITEITKSVYSIIHKTNFKFDKNFKGQVKSPELLGTK